MRVLKMKCKVVMAHAKGCVTELVILDVADVLVELIQLRAVLEALTLENIRVPIQGILKAV
jgi:hypothetical protein